MMTVDDIRGAYPSPISVHTPSTVKPCYDIGGALALYLYDYGLAPAWVEAMAEAAFPTPEELAALLMLANPALPQADAMWYAVGMLSQNDAGRVEVAWHMLGSCLAVGAMFHP